MLKTCFAVVANLKQLRLDVSAKISIRTEHLAKYEVKKPFANTETIL